MSVRTPLCNCLDCGKQLDAVTDPTGDKIPKDGDISICLECGHIMAFNDDLTVRNLTDTEIIEVAGMPELIRIQKARGYIMQNYKGKTP